MKNPWVRSVVLILGTILAAAALGAGGLFYLISRLDVRAEIERAVENATGRELTIEGDVGVTFWPVLGLKAERASLANVAGGRAPALVTMEELDIGVEIAPLFQRDVVVRRLVLQKPQVALEVGADGQNNWTFAPQTPPPGPTPTPPPTSEAPPPQPQSRFSLREVRTIDGEVSFYDARGGVGWIVGDADLTTSIESLNTPVRLEGSVRYADRPIDLNVVIGAPRSAIAGHGSAAEIKLDSDLLQVEFTGAALGDGQFQGNLNASGPNLRELAAWTGTPIQGGYGLENFAVAGRIGVNAGEYAFSNATFTVDRIAGRGDFTLSQSRGKPYLSGRLELMDFDLNPYLPGQTPPPEVAETPAPTTEGVAAPAAAPPAEIAVVVAPARAIDVTAAPSETPIDFSGLRGVNADVELITHAVLVQRMRIDSARVSVVLNDGFLASTLQDVRLYGGSASGRMEIDARALAVKLVQELSLQNVDAQRFLSDAINLQTIEGRAELQFRLRTQGGTQSELLSGVDGRAHIEVVSGALRGVDLGGVSRTIRNALRGELIAPEARTPFNGFSATFAIADGVLASNNLSFNTPDLRITGVGVIDTPQRRLDMRLAPRSPRGGLVFPFSVRGPFDQLGYTSDIRDTALREITARVSQVQTAARADAEN
ncbi:MAG: AsmA family protein [Hyphomonadaceae bacterium]|nr:AsmA family protein [Hyphomonadaceae bacterium]